jgi:hypothetical protein
VRSLLTLVADEPGNPLVKGSGPTSALCRQGQQGARRMQYHGVERHGPLGFGDYPAGPPANGRQPVGDGVGIAHRRREHEQRDARGQVDHGFFPHHAALFISQEMGFVQYHQVGVQ